MIGIAAGWHCGVDTLHVVLLLILSVLVAFFGIFRPAPQWLFGFGASLFMFSVGLFVEESKEIEMSSQWCCEKTEYRAQVVEEPVVKGASIKLLAYMNHIGTDSLKGERKQGTVYLYLPRSVEAEELKIGSMLLVKTTVLPFANAGNPAEFDSERYYYIKGVTGCAYVGQDDWKYEGEGDFTLRMKALQLRSCIVGLYNGLSLQKDERALLSALTVGEKSDFPKELKESYSAAGASHILALSGMHLGVFYVLLVVLLPSFGRNRVIRFVRESAIVLLLWTFAFMTGLSPSVVRAAVLFTLVSIGRCLGQDASGVNSLSFAAIAMLVVSPHLLFDVSFQLSFAAVLSIMLLAPPLQELLKLEEHGTLYSYIMNLMILSVVSQVGTLPFVWYYFGVFPLYFMLTNLVVVPLAFVIMALSVPLWVSAFVPFIQKALAMALEFVVELMNGFVTFIASLPGSSLELPPVDGFGASLVALLLIIFAYALVNSRRWMLAFSLCASSFSMLCLFLISGGSTVYNYIIIYNNDKNPLLHAVASHSENYLVSTVPQLDAEYEYSSSPYIKRENLTDPKWVDGTYSDSILTMRDGLLSFNGIKVRLVDNENWRDNVYVQPSDIVVLCRGFLGPVKELVEAYPSSCLVLDASLYKRSRQRILRECAALNIEPVDISQTGAMMILPGDENFSMVSMRGK